MSLYFGTDNDFTSKPQNSAKSGFNEWDLIKYKPDRDNKGLLSSLSINNTTEWTYADVVANVTALSELTADIDSNNVYYNLRFKIEGVSEVLSEVVRIEIADYCKNPIYVAWINGLGGVSYELFSLRQDDDINVDDGETVSANFDILELANVREFTIGANTRKSLTLYKENIMAAQKDRFNDFKGSIAKRDILVLNKKFKNSILSISDYDSTIEGCVLIYSPEHGQESDDDILIIDTTNYDSEYKVIKIDDDYIAVLATFVSTETGTIQRKLKNTDWLRCQAVDKSDPINNRASAFDIKFEFFLPTGT